MKKKYASKASHIYIYDEKEKRERKNIIYNNASLYSIAAKENEIKRN